MGKKGKFLAALALFCLAALPLPARPTVALVLSGGGAKGLAHVPIIEELERRGIVPDLVVGTSMGGLVGGLYASGYTPEDLRQYVLENNLMDAVVNVSSPYSEDAGRAFGPSTGAQVSIAISEEGVGSGNFLLSDSQINRLLHQAVAKVEGDLDFDELAIPFRTTGTDFSTGAGIVYGDGNLYEAMRATMSMPVIFPPVVADDGAYVVDGGVWNNLPVDIAEDLGADIIIAVDVNQDDLLSAEGTEKLDTLSGSVAQYITLISQVKATEQAEGADFVLAPPTSAYSALSFDRAEDILADTDAWVKENDALFDEIEEALSPWLPMERPENTYSELPRQTIRGFHFKGDLSRHAELFADFVGRPWDEETIFMVDSMLEEIRVLSNLKQVTYQFSDGFVEVTSLPYREGTGELSLSLSGGARSGCGGAEKKGFIAFDPDFTLAIEFWLGEWALTPFLTLGQAYELGFGASYSFSPDWAVGIRGVAGWGGYSAISDDSYAGRVDTRDVRLGAEAYLSYTPSARHRLDFGLLYDFYHYGGHDELDGKRVDLWDVEQRNAPAAQVSYHLDMTQLESNHQTGLSFEAQLTAGWNISEASFAYSLRTALDASVRLSADASSFLDLGFEAETHRTPSELASSWRYDDFGNATRDFLYGEASYRHYFFPRDNGFYVSGGIFGEGLARDEVWDSPKSLPLVPFTGLDAWEAGLSAAVGYVSELGEARLQCKVSFTGRLSLILEIR